MADSLTDDTTTEQFDADPLDAITERLTERFGQGDEENDEEAGEAADEDEGEGEGSTDDAPDGDDEHPESDTNADPDGDEAATDDDSDDDDQGADADDDDEHTEESDSDDDADDAGDEEEDGDEGDDVSKDTKAALEAHGADLALEDVPEEYRGLIEKKLKSVDAAFTRAQQEATAFRTERDEFYAEQEYRAKHPEFVVLELIEQIGPELLEKVNAELDKLEGDDADGQKAKLAETIASAKKEAAETVNAAVTEQERLVNRAAEVESYAKSAAKKAGIQWGATIERAVAAEILAMPEDKRDGITNAQIDAVIADYKKEHAHLLRSKKRDDSRELVRARTSGKRAPAPSRPPRGGSSPTPSAPRRERFDPNDEEARLAAMEKSAARIFSKRGAK